MKITENRLRKIIRNVIAEEYKNLPPSDESYPGYESDQTYALNPDAKGPPKPLKYEFNPDATGIPDEAPDVQQRKDMIARAEELESLEPNLSFSELVEKYWEDFKDLFKPHKIVR